MSNIYEHCTECPLDGNPCGHTCNAFCTNGEHCALGYSGSADINEARFVAEQNIRGTKLMVVRVERAVEAPSLADNPNRYLYPRPDDISNTEYKYLVWFRGCPDDCPRIVGSRE